MESSGVFVADTLAEFENALRVLPQLAGKRFSGRRVALASNAGFECVILADGLRRRDGLELARFSGKTIEGICALLHPLGIDRLQDIRNPLDLTPVADDATFAGAIDILIQDPGVDVAVVSAVPLTPALRTLPPGPDHAEDIHDAGSVGRRLIDVLGRSPKPVVMNIDAGALYDPMAQMLEQAGVAVFRRSDEALSFLEKLVLVRRRAAGLK